MPIVSRQFLGPARAIRVNALNSTAHVFADRIVAKSQRQYAHIHNGAAQRRAPLIDRKAVLDLVLGLMARLDPVIP